MLFPSCIKSNALLISLRGILCVIKSSILIFPSIYQSTIFGTSVRPLAPTAAPRPCRRRLAQTTAIVALAGPAANLLMAFFWAAIAKICMLTFHGNNIPNTITKDLLTFFFCWTILVQLIFQFEKMPDLQYPQKKHYRQYYLK